MAAVKYLDENGLSTVWSKVKGIVTPKADKVSGATNGHLAGLNSSGNLMDSGLPASNIAQKDGSYSGMTVGAAEDLVSAESVASEFTSRITGGSTAVGKGGTALLDKIKGRTLVWNQKINILPTTGSEYILGVKNEDGSYTLTVTSTLSTNVNLTAVSFFGDGDLNHKFFFGIDRDSEYVCLRNAILGNIETTAIKTFTSTSQKEIRLRIAAGTPAGTYHITPICVDLTLMFGAGNEPSTPEEFEALYPLPYYDYNPGMLISNAATAIETVGWNIWDEEWEVGTIAVATGDNVNSSTDWRSKNYIRVFPGTLYRFANLGTTNRFYLYYYTADGRFISYINAGTFGIVSFTTPANCYLLKFVAYLASTGYGLVYKHDICISLSDPSRDGTYEPYWRSELDLNIPTLTGKLNGTGNSVVIFPDGLRSAGTVYDEIIGNKAIKRIGKRSYASGDNEDVTLITDGTNTYYPIATPEEYILDDAIPTAMRNDPYGTERRLPADTAAIVTAPFRADITYSTNIKEAVQSLPQNYININSMQDFLSALGTLMGGTWTMRQADGKFDFTFTPNPSNE